MTNIAITAKPIIELIGSTRLVVELNHLFNNKSNDSWNGSDLSTDSTIVSYNMTEMVEKGDEKSADVSSIGSYYYLSMGAILSVILIIVLIALIIRKRRLDKLRHHLMPVYKFDPSEESGEDWETELLDGLTSGLTKGSAFKSRQLYTNEKPQLSFARV